MSKDYIFNDTSLQSVFAPAGKLLTEGDHIRRETYASTLETIAKKGVEDFYTVLHNYSAFQSSIDLIMIYIGAFGFYSNCVYQQKRRKYHAF